MKSHLFPALKLTLICIVFFPGFYLLLVYGIAQGTANRGDGVTIQVGNKSYYSNVGQSFTRDNYFHSRPSAVAYNAAGSGGSNKGPGNPAYLAEVQARIDTFLAHNPDISRAQIPADLVTASGSGLDPHISPQAASVQVKRIARVRNIPEEKIEVLIKQCTSAPWLGMFGTAKVNVLQLNIALDQIVL